MTAPNPSSARRAVRPAAARDEAPQAEYVPHGLHAYLVHPDHVLLAMAVTLLGLLVNRPMALFDGLAAVVVGCVALSWVDDFNAQVQFGRAWNRYRAAVNAWVPRWKPWHPAGATAVSPPAAPAAPTNQDSMEPGRAVPADGTVLAAPDLAPAAGTHGIPAARVYFAATCLTCNAVARWVRARHPVGLEIHAAEDHPHETLSRMQYDPMDGSPPESGVAGFARVLQHINLGYALVGAVMRLPILNWLLQVVADALGAGPRVIPRHGDTMKKLN
ncbi:MAG: hypothetical protein ACREJ2_12060 [Planctomycetota bacterium]